MKKTIIFLFTFFIFIRLSAQGYDCSTAKPFCLGGTYTYPATTGVMSPNPWPAYPNYGCLMAIPNPAWYYMKVGNPGDFVIHISSNTSFMDLDFVCWGPFTSPVLACMDSLITGNCTGNLCASGTCPDNTGSCGNPTFYPSGNIVDCDFSADAAVDCHIYGAFSDQYYIVLITNYSDESGNIIFTQTNAGQPGAGTTDCSIMQGHIHNNGPLCDGDTLKLYTDTIPGASYSWVGPAGWTSYQQNPIRPNVNAAMAGYYYCVALIGSQLSPIDSTLVIVNSLTTGTISGITTVSQGQQNVHYSVSPIPGADSYVWSLPIGVNGTSNTNSINVNFSDFAQSGAIKVKGHNSCGDGSYSSLNVLVHLNVAIYVNTGSEFIVYPSPVGLKASISYVLKTNQKFTLDIYDITGRKIKEIVNTYQQSGEHLITLDTSDLTQGVYLLKATADESFQTVKFNVVH